MTRYRALFGCAAIAAIVSLGFPGLTAMASDGAEPTTTESTTPSDATSDQQPAEPVVSPDPPTPPTPSETPQPEPSAEPSTPPVESATPPDESTVPSAGRVTIDPVATEPTTTTAAPPTIATTATEPVLTAEPTAAPTAELTATPAAASSAPLTLTAAAGVDGHVTLTWQPPLSDGGSPVIDYSIEQRTDYYDWFVAVGDVTTTSFTVSGLLDGDVHYFRVTARNADGTSGASNVASAIPLMRPSVPSNVEATAGSAAGTVLLRWTEVSPPWSGTIVGYRIMYARGGGTWTTITVPASGVDHAWMVTGLNQQGTYYFRISAHNELGHSERSDTVAAVPLTAPSVPRSLTATAGYGQVTLRWAAPVSSVATPIDGYTISYAPGGGSWKTINVSAATSSRTISGLRAGTGYYFRIAAYTSAGSSLFTTSVKGVPIAFRTPGAPAVYSVTTGNQSVGLYWSPPANTGGKPVTYYQIEIGSGGVWRNLNFVSGTQLAYKATGLVNGRTYSFRVRAAANAVGWSPTWSYAVRAVPVAPAPPPPPPPPVRFGGGTYRVGVDIPAGTYRSPRGTSDWCYWERLSGFSGSFDEIIANDFIDGTGPFVVTILPSDRGFFAEPVCGTWTKIG